MVKVGPAQKSTLWGRIRSDPLDGQQPHISQESADSFINPKSIKPSSTGSDKCREPWVHLSRHLFPPRRTEPKGPKPEFSGDSMKGFDGDVPLSRRKSWRQRYSEGWRAGMTVSCITALLVLILNTVVIIWASSRYPSVDGIGVIFGGECARAKRLNTWLQLVVNVLSSILLAASNYCMQCLGSPTRAEVDTAHAKGKMLDIGIPSIQNLGVIGRERGVLWAALAISALPLHFVFVNKNSIGPKATLIQPSVITRCCSLRPKRTCTLLFPSTKLFQPRDSTIQAY